MQSKVTQLKSSDHKDVKLTINTDFKHIATQHIAPIITNEMVRIGAELPIAFIKHQDTGHFICVALMGLKEGENLLVKDGTWQSTFIPAGLTHYPLAIFPDSEDSRRYAITIDNNSSAINDKGEALYDEEGNETEHLKQRRQILENYYRQALDTRAFTEKLVSMELLEEKRLTLDVGEEKRNVNGIYLVDEVKLNKLSEEDFLELRNLGFLPYIYAHLMSLGQTQRLVSHLSA